MFKLVGIFALIAAVALLINPVIFGFSLGAALSCITIVLIIGGGGLVIFG